MNESSFSSSDATNARRRMAHDTPSFSLGAGGFDTGEVGAGRGGGYAYAAGGQWLTQYLRRVWSWDQIDYDSTFDQMVTLMGAPKHMSKVYKLANYRKKTKNQWARDDPGFAMIQLGWVGRAAASLWTTAATYLPTRVPPASSRQPPADSHDPYHSAIRHPPSLPLRHPPPTL